MLKLLTELLRLYSGRRGLIFIGAVSLSFSLLFSFANIGLLENGTESIRDWIYIPMTFAILGSIVLVLAYLQSGTTTLREKNTYSIDEFKNYAEIAILSEKFHIQNEVLKKINDELKFIKSENSFNAEEKKLIIEKAISKLDREVVSDIFKQEVAELEVSIKRNFEMKSIDNDILEMKERMLREISDLRLRANLNLLIGMSITIFGIYLLWSTISIVDSSQLLRSLANDGAESNYKFIKSLFLPLIPRMSLVIFIEIFAYFFLRLYKNGLSEIKFFQNEMTNIESKIISLKTAQLYNHTEAFKLASENLSKTERNFLISKSQTTVELEKAKSFSDLGKCMLKVLPRFFKEK